MNSTNITPANLAKIVGVKERRLRQFVEDGTIPAAQLNGYPLVTTLIKLFEFYRNTSERRAAMVREREALAKARREKIEFDVATSKGLHISKSELEPALRNYCLNQKACLRYKLEQELPFQIVGLDAHEILKKTERIVDEVCEMTVKSAGLWLAPTPETKNPK